MKETFIENTVKLQFYVKLQLYDFDLWFKVPVVDLNACREKYDVDEKNLCAGGEIAKDSCSGDSGGGLFSNLNDPFDGKETRWEVVGIVSFGTNLCGNGTPGVYTRVSQYLQWIEDTMNKM